MPIDSFFLSNSFADERAAVIAVTTGWISAMLLRVVTPPGAENPFADDSALRPQREELSGQYAFTHSSYAAMLDEVSAAAELLCTRLYFCQRRGRAMRTGVVGKHLYFFGRRRFFFL